MKKFWLTTVIALFIVVCSTSLWAQTSVSDLDQLKLMEKFLGNRQLDGDKDTLVEITTCSNPIYIIEQHYSSIPFEQVVLLLLS